MFGSSGFGSTPSTFGASTFGATANTGGSVFGQPAQQQPTTSLFGGGATAFGTQQATLPAFGAGATTASTGAFGAQPNTSSVFGQQARPTTGIFSSTATTISPFSAQTQVAGTSIPFSAITGTDTMMKNGAASQINTRHQCITCMKEYENKSLEELRLEDYQLNRKGPSSSMFGAGATAAPQAQPGTGLFSGIGGAPGAQTPGTSTFGQTSAFGQTAPTAGGGLFSSLNQPKPGGFFGNTATSTSTGFGGGSTLGFSFNNATSQPQASIFGQNNNNPATSNTGLGNPSAFSFSAQPQQQQQGLSLFGQKPLTTPASSAPTFGGGFGSTATNTTLNKPLFGAGGTTTFGQVSAAPTFGSGTGSLFSTNTQPQQAKPFTFSTPFSSTQATSQPTFGNTSTSTFSFSNPVSTPAVNFGTGTAPTFGSNTGTTGTFGAPLSFSLGSNAQQQPQTGTTGSTFGTGFFSSGTTNTATGGTGTGLSLFGSGGGTGALGTGFGGGGLNLQQTQQLQQQQQQQLAQGAITFATTPFKDNQLFYNLISNRKIEDMTKPTNPMAQRQYREASRRKTSTGAGPTTSSSTFSISMSPAVKNLTFASSTKNSSITKFKIFDGFEDEDYGVGVDILSPKTNVKKLVLKNPDIICSPSSSSGNGENGSIGMARRSSLLGISSPANSNRASLQSPLAQNRRNRLTLNSSLNVSDLSYVSPESGGNYGEPNRTIGDFGDSINDCAGPSSMLANQSLNHSGSSDGGDGYINGSGLNGAVNLSSKRGSEIDVGSSSFLNGGVGRNSSSGGSAGSVCGVTCTRPQYYLKPSLEDLDRMMDSNGVCLVKGLEIGRVNFGRIKYLMPVNVANINIDDIVHFRHKEVTVYPDDKNKPELGNGLNAPAEIELDRVWPVDKATNELIRNPDEIQKLDYEAKLRKACTRTGSEFISYNREHGVWKFKVPHFSKYSCDVEEDEEDATAGGAQQGLPPKGLGGISQQKLQQQRASMSLAAGGTVMAGQGGPPGAAGDALGRMSLPAHFSGMPPPPPPPVHQQHLMEGGHPPASDVELNPLTPCDSDDEDDDDLDDDDGDDDLDEHDLVIRRPSVRMSSQPTLPQQGHPASLPKYKPILEDCGTEKSRLMKSVMSISEFGDGDPTSMSIIDSQPPTKKSRPPMMMSLMATETEFPEEGQRLKKRLSMMQGPGSSTSVSAAQAPAVKAPAPTIRPVEPTQFSEEPMSDLFSSLRPSQITSALRLEGCARVCFLPNGHFLTVSQSTTPKTGQFNGQVKLNQLVSYADKQEIAPLSASYRAVLEKQMQDRLDKEGVLFQEHLFALRNEVRGCSVTQVKKMLESELAIWELCDILWPGELDIEPEFFEDDGFLLHQRQRLGEWFKKHAELLFGDGYNEKDASVLGLMKKGLVESASDAAIREGNLWLSVVLASSPHQHLEFEEDQEEIFDGMPKDTSDVFALVSGNLRKLSWLNADKVHGMTTHEWLQHFALHIWYEGPVRSLLPVSVEQAVREYEEMMREIAQDEECPLPTTESSTVANLAMHLLKLYSCTGYPMNIVLTPRTWTDDCLDYKLDWLLMRSLEEIGYSPGDDVYKAICLGYTGMLEGISMWKWCQFVMSHLPGPECEAGEDSEQEEAERLARESFCERLLERNIGEGMSREENFLVYKLGVPEMLLYSIKGWKSLLGNRKRADENMWYLGMMGDWQQSYGVLTNYLESGLTLDLIGKRVPSQATNIQQHLARLEANQSRIAGWEIHGKMLTNYLKMLFEQGDVDATEAAVISFMESVIKFKPVNTYQCAFLLDMALSAQKVIQLLLAEPEITAERRARIEDNLVQFLEINVPKEYFDGLRCFINFSMMNNTAPFRVLEYMERDDIDDEQDQAILMRA